MKSIIVFISCLLVFSQAASIWVDPIGGTDDAGCGNNVTTPCQTLTFTLIRASQIIGLNLTSLTIEIINDFSNATANINGSLFSSYFTLTFQPASNVSVISFGESTLNLAAYCAVNFVNVEFVNTTVTAFDSSFNTCMFDTSAVIFAPAVNPNNKTNQTHVNTISLTLSTLLNSDVYTPESVATVMNSQFTSSWIYVMGGSLSNSNFSLTVNDAAVTSDGGPLIVNNCNFLNNTGLHGAALSFVNSGNQLVSIFNSAFINNAAQVGPAIAGFVGVTVTLNNTYFMGNNAAGSGGAIYNVFTVNCDSLTNFTMNSAGNGGAFGYVSESGVASIQNCKVFGNTAVYGGAFSFVQDVVANNSNETFSAVVNMCSISMGFSQEGGAIYADGVTANFTNNLFQSNSANVTGGAIYATNGTTVYLINNNLVDNVAKVNGSALYLESTAVLVSVNSNNITSIQVTNKTVEVVYCPTCNSCPAASSCSDCDQGCIQIRYQVNMTVGNFSSVVCYLQTNACQNDGVCQQYSAQQPTCQCSGDWNGATCSDEKGGEDHLTIIIVVSVVGGLVALAIIIFAIRAVANRKKSEYSAIRN